MSDYEKPIEFGEPPLMPPAVDLDKIQREETKKIGAFMAMFMEKAMSQLRYDIEQNIPKGYLGVEGIRDHALKSAIASSIGTYLEWSIDPALQMCVDILEDVNAHKEAAKVNAMIGVD